MLVFSPNTTVFTDPTFAAYGPMNATATIETFATPSIDLSPSPTIPITDAPSSPSVSPTSTIENHATPATQLPYGVLSAGTWSTFPASDWSVMGIYPCFLRMIGRCAYRFAYYIEYSDTCGVSVKATADVGYLRFVGWLVTGSPGLSLQPLMLALSSVFCLWAGVVFAF
eukprot:2568444-Pyramimonas_sp.AAC.1